MTHSTHAIYDYMAWGTIGKPTATTTWAILFD